MVFVDADKESCPNYFLKVKRDMVSSWVFHMPSVARLLTRALHSVGQMRERSYTVENAEGQESESDDDCDSRREGL